ncbi:MAG TPA: hypothetical protein VNT30_01425 [Stellaceae bacterium]|nr:hypothetical protein [Stellaceae bacterium]
MGKNLFAAMRPWHVACVDWRVHLTAMEDPPTSPARPKHAAPLPKLLSILFGIATIALLSAVILTVVGPVHAAIKAGEPAHTAVLTDVERDAAKRGAVREYEKSVAQIDKQAARGELTPEQREENTALQRQILYRSLARLNGTAPQRQSAHQGPDIE